MEYVYENPIGNGYKRFYLRKKDHNELFPNLELTWLNRYEYYINEKNILIHRFASRSFVILAILFYPIIFILHGILNFREVNRDYRELLNQKKYGAFSSHCIWSGSDLYQEIKDRAILRNKI